MWVMENVGRYLAQKGMYLAAQQPRTMRSFHGFRGLGETEAIVWAMRRIIVSASLSSWRVWG